MRRKSMRKIIHVLMIVWLVAAAPAMAHDGGSSSTYNDEYIFAVTRGVRDSGVHPVVVAMLSPLTVALDLGLLPFELIVGIFP